MGIQHALAQPILDDHFDDGSPATNANGVGGGFNPTFNGVVEESNSLLNLGLDNSASTGALLSQATFTANSAQTIYGSFTYTEMIRPDASPASNDVGTSRWYAGFYDNSEDTNLDGFDAFGTPNQANASNANQKGGLWIAFKEREDEVGRDLVGDEGSLYYTLANQQTYQLATWTWDRSIFSFAENEIVNGLRSDRIPQDLVVPDIRAELGADSTGYSLKFYSNDDDAILPLDVFGTWASAGVTDLSSLNTVRAVGLAGQNGQLTEIKIDRVYVDDAPQRDADDSGQLFTWGARPNDNGSWSATDGWQVGGVNTTNIPKVVTATRAADAVRVLGGTVRVDTANQGAWSLQVDSGATAEVSSGFTLEVIDNESVDATNVMAGGNIVLGGTLISPMIGGGGNITFADGTLRVDQGSIGSIETTSDGTISNTREVSVGQATLGAGDTLIKQRAGSLILNQSQGSNSLAAGSAIDVQRGAVVGVNSAASNAFGSSTVTLNGGNLGLGASAPSSAAFDSAIVVSKSASIDAAQFAGALAGQTVTLGGTNGMSIAADATATLRTSDGYSINVVGSVAGAGTLSVGDGADVNLSGNVSTSIVEFRGDVSGVSIGAGVAPAQAFRITPTAATPASVVGFAINGAADVIVDGVINGTVRLNNTSNSYTGATRIATGALIPDAGGLLPGDYNGDTMVTPADYSTWKSAFGTTVPAGTGADGNGNGIVDAADYAVWRDNLGNSGGGGGMGLPANSLLQFEGGDTESVAVLQTSQNFSRDIGTAAGQVNWVGAGGFAATGGGTVNVTLEGGADLTWDSASAGFNSQALMFGSATADGRVVLTNNINLNNDVRTVQLTDNPDLTTDVAEISGDISSSAGGADVLLVRGPTLTQSGLLVLSGSNSFTKLEIGEGTVQAVDGVGLPANANLLLRSAVTNEVPAVFASNGTFARNIGQGAGQVYWATDLGLGGGFAAVGGNLTVTLQGGAALNWATDLNSAELQLGSTVADGVTTFTNNIDGGATNRTFETFDNPLSDTDRVVLSGSFTNYNNFRIDGDGEVELSGSVAMTGNMVLVNNAYEGTLKAVVSGTGTVGNNISLDVSGANLFVNGSVSVDNDLQARSGNTLGGSGTISLFDNDSDGNGTQRAQISGFLNPGSDYDDIGTLTFNLTRAGGDGSAATVDVQNGAIYEMEFANNGGSLEHDSTVITSSSGIGRLQLGLSSTAPADAWTLELNALNDLTGLINGSDEFNVLTWNDNIDFFINGAVQGAGTSGEVQNVVLSSTVFDVSGATVGFEVAANFSGRVFVSGLTLAGGSGALSSAVPEPATCSMVALAMLAFGAAHRRRT